MKVNYGHNHQQRGMVLLVALVMVVLMSLIAVASIKGSNLQEAMSGGMRDRNMAFQAAESALRKAENTVVTTNVGALAIQNKDGYFVDLNKSSTTPRPTEWTLNDWKDDGLQLSGIEKVSVQPFVVTEQLSYSGNVINSGDGIDFISQERNTEYQFYRITVRASGLTENTEVILQSTYVR